MVRRFVENPILTPSDIPATSESMKVECLLNPGTFRFKGKTWLILRVAERPFQREGEISFPILGEESGINVMRIASDSPDLDLGDPRVISYKGEDYLTTMSHFRLVSSEDGIHFHEDPEYPPILPSGPLEAYGIEDCRVAQIGTTYYLTFTSVSKNGVAVGMKRTEDWKSFEDCGLILPPHNKDCALFEEKVGGLYRLLHRPSSPEIGGNYIWMAESPDLIHWGNHKCIARTRKGFWDSARIGAGCSPIRTEDGWLVIYHGADESNRYCLGTMLLDPEDPTKVLARCGKPFMEPAEPYETGGFFGQVIFSNGMTVDGDRVIMYYGAADSVVCAAELSVKELLKTL